MPVRPMLLHRMALVSFRLFCKNLGNLQEIFGQMVYRPPPSPRGRTFPVRLCRSLSSSLKYTRSIHNEDFHTNSVR